MCKQPNLSPDERWSRKSFKCAALEMAASVSRVEEEASESLDGDTWRQRRRDEAGSVETKNQDRQRDRRCCGGEAGGWKEGDERRRKPGLVNTSAESRGTVRGRKIYSYLANRWWFYAVSPPPLGKPQSVAPARQNVNIRPRMRVWGADVTADRMRGCLFNVYHHRNLRLDGLNAALRLVPADKTVYRWESS